MLTAIKKRKSIRKFKSNLNSDELNKVKEYIKSAEPLDESLSYNVTIVEDGSKIETLFEGILKKYVKVSAPHYLVFSSKEEDNYMENIGYVGEQIVLNLTKIDVATCWIGAPINNSQIKKIGSIPSDHKYIILVGFGKP